MLSLCRDRDSCVATRFSGQAYVTGGLWPTRQLTHVAEALCRDRDFFIATGFGQARSSSIATEQFHVATDLDHPVSR